MAQSKVLDSAQLRQTGRGIQEICIDVKKNFDMMKQEMDATIGTDAWDGERAARFKNAWDEFTQAFIPVYNKISRISNQAVDSAIEVERYTK